MTFEESVKRYHKMVKLREKGATLAEIGKMFGITRQAVEQRLKKGEPKIAEYFGGILGQAGLAHLEGRDRARTLVRIRDDYTCQDCGLVRTYEEVAEFNKTKRGLKGRKKQLDVHHTHGMCGKNSRGYDATSDISKMVTLCHKCHFNRPEHRVKSKVSSKK